MRVSPRPRAVIPLAALILLGLSTSLPATAVTTAPLVNSTTLAPSRALLVGESTVRITVSTHITAPDGQTRNSASDASLDDPTKLTFPFVRLQRTQGAWYLPQLDERSLTLLSGTIADGNWTTSFDVPSTYDGQWRITRVCTQTLDLQVHCAAPATPVTLSIDGRNYPLIKATVVPRAPPQWPDIHLTLLTSDTRAPIEGRTLVLCTNISCDEVDPPRGLTLVTDRFGRTAPHTSGIEYFARNRAWYLANPSLPLEHNVHWQDVSVDAAVRFVISVQPITSVIKLGNSVTFTGAVHPILQGGRITLQRWVHQRWRTLSSARLSETGAYTITTKPNSIGSHIYRLVKSSDRCDPFRCLLLGSVTRTYSVRVY